LGREALQRAAYAWAWRIKFQPEYIVADLMLGWLVGFNGSNHG
jgi:hypothetical protein